MTAIWLGFDTESDVTQWAQQPGLPITRAVVDESLAAVARSVEILRAHQVTATYFLVGRLLEVAGPEYVALLTGQDIECHTYAHNPVHAGHSCSISPAEMMDDVRRGLDFIEDYFGVRPRGLCAPGGAVDGMRGQRERLRILWDAGIRFVKSDNWGPGPEMPVPYTPPYTYAEDGLPELWELPGSGWHCTMLLPRGEGMQVSGPVIPGGPWPEHLPTKVDEAIDHIRQELDYTREHNLHYAPSWHPWSLYRFDPNLTMLEFLLDYAEEYDMPIRTYRQVYEMLVQGAKPEAV
ncbi:MAG TPA: polysaccharide deacetylase family protein [Armatimonadota bacterium]|jgi:peptidoglycan/xylan/chitin deacetylase (PgdA/CDA1 family)